MATWTPKRTATLKEERRRKSIFGFFDVEKFFEETEEEVVGGLEGGERTRGAFDITEEAVVPFD